MPGFLAAIGPGRRRRDPGLDTAARVDSVALPLVAAAWNLSPAGWFAERVRSGGPDGARRLRGHHAGSGNQGGQAADDPGGGCRAALLVPQLSLAGRGQHLVVVLAGQPADAIGMGEDGLLLLLFAARLSGPSPDRLAYLAYLAYRAWRRAKAGRPLLRGGKGP
jgi:hypothetical protein